MKEKGLTGNGLKLIAIFTMLLDHIGYVILERGLLNQSLSTAERFSFGLLDYALRATGRLAFIIFLFLLVEGFMHTSNVLKYALRMLVFALISEIPFNIAVSGHIFYPEYQSVYVTLLLSLVMMVSFEFVSSKSLSKPVEIGADIVIFLIFSTIAYFAKCDYTTVGIAMAAAMYFGRNNSTIRFWAVLGVILLYTVLPIMLMTNGVPVPYTLYKILGNSSPIEVLGVLSFLFIKHYNGERGSFNLKYVFYIFYPAHLLILGLITAYLFNGGVSLR